VHTAVRIGRFFAYLMIAIGVLELFTGGVVDGVWLAFLGWFLLSAGQSEEAGTVIKASLRSVPVSAAMSSPVVTIPDWLSVEQFLESVAPAHHFATYPVHDPSGALTGVVRLNDLVRLGAQSRRDARLSAVSRPISQVPVTRPDEDLSALIERVGPALENRALVFDGGRLVGIVSPVDIARLLTAREAVGRS
jgi:CBS-domain-containing membrane protein